MYFYFNYSSFLYEILVFKINPLRFPKLRAVFFLQYVLVTVILLFTIKLQQQFKLLEQKCIAICKNFKFLKYRQV